MAGYLLAGQANRFANVVTVRSRPPARAERVRTGTPSRPAGVLAYEVAAAKCHAIDEGGAAVLPRSTSRGGISCTTYGSPRAPTVSYTHLRAHETRHDL